MTSPTSQQLVSDALAGKPAQRVPSGPLAVHFCAGLAGATIRDYTLDAGVLAECVIRYYERFQPDAVWLSADTWVSAQAMGAQVGFPGDNQPLAGTGEPLIQSPADLRRVPLPDPTCQGRWPLMLEALRRIRRALGSGVFLTACFDQYPFSLACAVLGIEKAMTLAIEQAPELAPVMERCAEFAVAYAVALAENGADSLSGGDSPAGLLGPSLYRQVALPGEQKVISAVRARCPLPIALHICGNATPILGAMAQSGANILELDHQVDLVRAAEILPPDLALWGNLDPVSLLARGTPGQVRKTATEAMAAMGRLRRRFVLSSGCTLAMETPAENLDALVDSARQFIPE